MKVDFDKNEMVLGSFETEIPELNEKAVRALLLEIFDEPREIPESVSRYFLYEYGLKDVKGFFEGMVSDGYLIKVDSGLYVASAKGSQYAEQHAYYRLLHKHHEWDVDLEEFENRFNGDVDETIQNILDSNLRNASDIYSKKIAYKALYEYNKYLKNEIAAKWLLYSFYYTFCVVNQNINIPPNDFDKKHCPKLIIDGFSNPKRMEIYRKAFKKYKKILILHEDYIEEAISVKEPYAFIKRDTFKSIIYALIEGNINNIDWIQMLTEDVLEFFA